MPDKRVEPSPLSEIKTEYERFCEEHGGAVRPAAVYGEVEFSIPCKEYPFQLFIPIFEKWQPDPISKMRHWPPMAYAASEFAYRSKLETENKSEKLQPKEVIELLQNIQNASEKLRDALRRLERQGFQLQNPVARLRSEHLAWLDAFIAQAAAGNFGDKVDEHPKQMTITQVQRRKFLDCLAQVQAAAKEAQNRVDKEKLRLRRGKGTSALTNFVWLLAPIWESLTAKRATAYLMAGTTSDDAPFVSFVGELAGIAGQPAPSWKQVKNALKVHPPR